MRRINSSDIAPTKKDIDELLDEFSQGESMSFADMKRVWASRKFTYIFEAAPTPTPFSSANLAFFMQSLFAHTIGHMVGSRPLSRRIGGLYCLYCLHETQPYKPPFRINITLRELKNIKELVSVSKERGISAVPHLVKRMLDKNMFLFGALDVGEAGTLERINHLIELQNARVEVAYKKLFANTRIEDFLYMDLGLDVELDVIKKMSSEYHEAKRLAIKEAEGEVNIQDIEHIAQGEELIGDVVENIAGQWSSERESFCKQTGISLELPATEGLLLLPPPEQDDDLDFEHKLEQILSEEC